MKQSNSMHSKIWSYLIIFSIVILTFLWLFQVIFLKSYYKWMTTKNIVKIVNEIKQNYNVDNFSDILDELTFSNNVCIEFVTNSNFLYSSNSCLIDRDINDRNYIEAKMSFLQSNDATFQYEITNTKFHNQTLVYGQKIASNVTIFVTASLEPLDSTIGILASQLVYVTIGVMLLSFVVAYFISKKLSKPISQINENAKEMANGNYNIEFKTNTNIKEIDELADTLDNTSVELSKTENLRREFLANVSHDLKTPLTMIKAYAEMERDFPSKNVKKRTENLNVIIEETDRLNLLVNDILELSKVQANVNKLEIEQFNLIELIKSILKRYDYLVMNENYNFVFEYKTNNVVKADKKRIEQVIYNLINNAINYTGDDKKVIIRVLNTNDGVKVEIADTGKGIDEKDLDLIWEKYYKVDKTYQRELKGTGLGLSIVKNILVNHGFKYGVESIKKKGTTFWFIIK